MNTASAFQSLIDLARNDTDRAGKELGQLVSERHNAQTQLSMLHDYRLDYAHRLQHATQTGLPASSYQNFRKFLATLDDAISQQDRVVAHKDTGVLEGRQHWQSEKRRLNAFEALETRARAKQRDHENRSDQIACDETSAGMFRRMRNT
ncbi:flagellar export protein FliJ [Allopusillimonas ginsengisoli]|uniref:flagellar export protein FliJ n=1 Tax=Allopusillimonas ginsengisoli TaxID=453575 RepID=UPI0010C2086B|nr:flagellar export protein FliJ [Allopusillimonas ginsengisoli]